MMLHFPHGHHCLMKVIAGGANSIFAIATLETETLEQLPGFKRRMDWFISNRPEKKMLPVWKHRACARRLLIAYPNKLRRILQRC